MEPVAASILSTMARFQMITEVADDASPILEAFFYGNADSFYDIAGFSYDGDQSL